jgi:Ser/Thr protein kinase RdoA (MazF antagonist)
LVLIDDERMVVVMNKAPDHLREWKSELLAGGNGHSADTATRLGEILARLHSRTFHDSRLTDRFGDIGPFIALRIDPFHRTIARKHPHLSIRLGQLADELITTPTCLVHGDFSPKNVLSAGSEVWLLDWEVAHLGVPTFDVAFLLAHLVCKTIHAPQFGDRYRECAQSFIASYQRDVREELRLDGSKVIDHTAAVILARADGKSPANYLTLSQRETTRTAATQWLTVPATKSDVIDQLWSDLP